MSPASEIDGVEPVYVVWFGRVPADDLFRLCRDVQRACGWIDYWCRCNAELDTQARREYVLARNGCNAAVGIFERYCPENGPSCGADCVQAVVVRGHVDDVVRTLIVANSDVDVHDIERLRKHLPVQRHRVELPERRRR